MNGDTLPREGARGYQGRGKFVGCEAVLEDMDIPAVGVQTRAVISTIFVFVRFPP